MLARKKVCSGCNQEQYIYKSDKRDKYCKNCWFRLHPPAEIKMSDKPINPVSKKRQKKNRVYSKKREDRLQEDSTCQAKLPGCIVEGTDVHHLYSGRDRDKFFTDFDEVIVVCRYCHHLIHDILSSEELIELGLKKIDY